MVDMVLLYLMIGCSILVSESVLMRFDVMFLSMNRVRKCSEFIECFVGSLKIVRNNRLFSKCVYFIWMNNVVNKCSNVGFISWGRIGRCMLKMFVGIVFYLRSRDICCGVGISVRLIKISM